MKRLFILFLILLTIPNFSVHAKDYILNNGKYEAGTYIGSSEEDYNYYMIKPNKSGYLAITVKTSDQSNLLLDICNENREIIASDISIENKKTVYHACNKGKIYYLKVKGKEGVNFQVSYKMVQLDKFKYAKKYNYTFTNASLQKSDSLQIPIKVQNSGILHFMLETDKPLSVKYYNNRKKVISSDIIMDKKDLSGIGVQAKGKYYIRIYNPENTFSGTTTICNLKYQVDPVAATKNTSKGRAKTLIKNQYARTLVVAGKKTTAWYRIKINKKQKLTITLDSQMMQNNGKNLQLYICNSNGKKINTSPIIISGEATISYKKKYIMKYPKTVFGTTAEFPEGTYYIKIESKTKTSSGAFQIKWN